MSTTTTNFGLTKPAPFSAADQNQWGTQVNTTIDLIDAQLATRTEDYDFDTNQAIDMKVKAARESKYNFVGDISANAVTINYNNGNYQYATISTDVAITFSNFPASDVGFLTLCITQNGTGGHDVTFTQTVRTPGGGDLTPTTTAGAVNKFRVECEGSSSFPYDIFLNQNMLAI